MGAISGLARLTALMMTITLAGCVTAENSLSQNDISTMKLTGVTVGFAPDASVQWEEGARAYANAKAVPEEQIMVEAYKPEGRAFIQNMLAQRIKTGIERAMVGSLNGSRPVKLVVTVRSFQIASAVQTVLIGNDRRMYADADLVDARTGEVIMAFPKQTAFIAAPSGLLGVAVQAAFDANAQQSVADQIIGLYGSQYRRWLLHETT